ncbi:Similar to Ribosomal RNA-processing protein 14-C; acc. no. O43082 [Pyronema omphalodes CBS 100304]|uniref:Similar to Ribosomal RNA-processing protein 14-C acc. no. O43082 n=1 Tax=Pyronema omphalodes (strain CBS 100304) TaxID=1076935 RepID=U4LEC4_PYROM|nr:Similar to Ribosomal RNA-processing protein 14-C; acc. no. O43082 [Pyronema omphalodes CBS 100304]
MSTDIERPYSSAQFPLNSNTDTYKSQWNKRKQSKEERKSAKKAKLDPESATSAAEVRQKRLHDETEGASGSDAEVETEPVQKKQKAIATPKKQTKAADKQQPASEKKQKEKKTPNKKQQEKSNTTPAKSPANKKGKAKPSDEPAAAQSEAETPATAEIEVEVREKAPSATKKNDDNDDDDVMGESIQVNGFADLASEPTSPSSTAPPTTTSSPTATSKPLKPLVSAEEKAEQKARLAARIEALRASRKADNVDGSNARSRSELMEARRKKEALRKERKKAARLVAKSQAEEGIDEAAAASGEAAGSSSGKPNPVSVVKNFSFGMVTWDDGAQTTADLGDFKKEKKKVGPRDIMGQLKKTEAKNKRIAQMSDEKREVVLEKEKWAKAIKQAQGEKVKDDEKLLKKALKRQEATKRKSSSAWTERLAGQAKAKSERIKKREDNIQARKDAKKNGKSSKKPVHKKGGKPGGKGKKGGRPGFEGGMKLGGKGIPNGKGKK